MVLAIMIFMPSAMPVMAAPWALILESMMIREMRSSITLTLSQTKMEIL